MTKRTHFEEAAARSPLEANRLLFKWLSDDEERARLYRSMLDGRWLPGFQSRADTKQRATDDADSVFHQDVFLIGAREHVKRALTDRDSFSNAPYQPLGSGTFMLGLDGGDHKPQREFASAYLVLKEPVIAAIANVAFLAAAVLPLKQRKFDLVYLAEQAAARFVGFLFGYAQADHALLEETTRRAYRGLAYQMLGRHFVSEPGAVQDGSTAMGMLLRRTAELIDIYRGPIGRKQEEEFAILTRELDELRDFTTQNRKDPAQNSKPLREFEPLLRRMAAQKAGGASRGYSTNELAVMVVGMIAGTVHNIQAGVCVAINEFLAADGGRGFERARDAAIEAQKADAGQLDADRELKALVWEALRLNPPAPFLPRRTTRPVRFNDGAELPKDRVVILAVGAATRDIAPDPDQFRRDRGGGDELIFGGGEKGGYLHQCIGTHLAMPVITHVVRQVLLLPGLAQSLDPVTGKAYGLQKLWGFMCDRFPLEFTRSKILTQSPLIVIMKVKQPVAKHAETLKEIIRHGAPRIEKKLREARHVHFAQFLFIENDTRLVLFTIYDRDFDSYIEHFALEIGPLFDRIFEHIQDAPPLPVDKFPKEFVNTIRYHNSRPVSDYFFSAYPLVDVAMITHEFTRKNT